MIPSLDTGRHRGLHGNGGWAGWFPVGEVGVVLFRRGGAWGDDGRGTTSGLISDYQRLLLGSGGQLWRGFGREGRTIVHR